MAKKELPITDEEPEVCSSCLQELTRHRWNTRVDILYCENRSCRMRHIPQGNIDIQYQHHTMDFLNSDEAGLTRRRRQRTPVPA